MNLTKKCYKCQIIKPVNEFHKNRAAYTRLKFARYCKECTHLQRIKYYARTGK